MATRTMDLTETTPTPTPAPPPRKTGKPGPRPGWKAAREQATNGHGNGAVAPVSALVALQRELAATEATAGRLRRALQALQA